MFKLHLFQHVSTSSVSTCFNRSTPPMPNFEAHATGTWRSSLSVLWNWADPSITWDQNGSSRDPQGRRTFFRWAEWWINLRGLNTAMLRSYGDGSQLFCCRRILIRSWQPDVKLIFGWKLWGSYGENLKLKHRHETLDFYGIWNLA